MLTVLLFVCSFAECCVQRTLESRTRFVIVIDRKSVIAAVLLAIWVNVICRNKSALTRHFVIYFLLRRVHATALSEK